MNEIQALKFARVFKKHTVESPLILEKAYADNWLRELYDSFEKAQGKKEDVEPYLQAEEEFLRGRHEERIIVRDGSDSSAG